MPGSTCRVVGSAHLVMLQFSTVKRLFHHSNRNPRRMPHYLKNKQPQMQAVQALLQMVPVRFLARWSTKHVFVDYDVLHWFCWVQLRGCETLRLEQCLKCPEGVLGCKDGQLQALQDVFDSNVTTSAKSKERLRMCQLWLDTIRDTNRCAYPKLRKGQQAPTTLHSRVVC